MQLHDWARRQPITGRHTLRPQHSRQLLGGGTNREAAAAQAAHEAGAAPGLLLSQQQAVQAVERDPHRPLLLHGPAASELISL